MSIKNYRTVWVRWAAAKATIVQQHERLKPLIEAIKGELVALSGQDIPPVKMSIEGLPILFYPFWGGGWAYSHSRGWDSTPNPKKHWEWSLKETEAVAEWLTTLQEEEVKILFRNWSEAI